MLDIQRESAYAGLKDTTTHPIVPPTTNEKTMTGADILLITALASSCFADRTPKATFPYWQQSGPVPASPFTQGLFHSVAKPGWHSLRYKRILLYRDYSEIRI